LRATRAGDRAAAAALSSAPPPPDFAPGATSCATAAAGAAAAHDQVVVEKSEAHKSAILKALQGHFLFADMAPSSLKDLVSE